MPFVVAGLALILIGWFLLPIILLLVTSVIALVVLLWQLLGDIIGIFL